MDRRVRGRTRHPADGHCKPAAVPAAPAARDGQRRGSPPGVGGATAAPTSIVHGAVGRRRFPSETGGVREP
jgi:hypothetical protein